MAASPLTTWLPLWRQASSPESDTEGSRMGILKTVATVAVASTVHGHIQRRQQSRWAAEDQASSAPQSSLASSPPSSAVAMGDKLSQLAQLGDLRQAGVLSEAEFQQQKTYLLSG
jgi:hypothetical protein